MRAPLRIVVATVVIACYGLMLPVAQSQLKPGADTGKKGVAKPQAAGGTATADAAEEQAIRASAEAFTRAYNNHNARALGELFAPQAEIIDEGGHLTRGREAIEKAFADVFKEHPKVAVACEIDSIRVLTPNLGVEEGLIRSKNEPEALADVSSYVAVHVKVDGKWLVASVRDFEVPAPDPSPHDRLEELAWLVGDWIDESPQAVVHTSCEWDTSGNFLIQKFDIRVAGRSAMTGTMRIGWDAVRKQIRSWVFDSQGGHSEGSWLREGDKWIVKAHGSTSAGKAASAVNIYRRENQDTIAWRSIERTLDGERLDDIPAVTIKRRPPPPKK